MSVCLTVSGRNLREILMSGKIPIDRGRRTVAGIRLHTSSHGFGFDTIESRAPRTSVGKGWPYNIQQ